MLKEFGHEILTADGPDVALVGFRSPTSCRLGLVGDFKPSIIAPLRLPAIRR